MNQELMNLGYRVQRGKVNRQYFMEKYCYSEYKCWPLELKNKSNTVTDLVVPHHGGYADLRNKKILPNFDPVLNNRGYLSTGISNDISEFPNSYQEKYLAIDCKFNLHNTRELIGKKHLISSTQGIKFNIKR